MGRYVNDDTVTYDIYTNTISIIAKDCVIDFLTEPALMEIVKRKYSNHIGINVYVNIEAIGCHISEIYLPGMTFITLTLNGSIIKGVVNFYGTKFIGEVNCSATVFQEEVVLLATHFYQDALFDYSVFEGEVDMTLVEGRHISFLHARFNEMTYLEELFFEESVLFDYSIFKYDFCLFNCFLKGGVSVENARLNMNCTIEGIVTNRIDLANIIIGNRLEIRKIKAYKGCVVVQFEDERFMTLLDNKSYFENSRVLG